MKVQATRTEKIDKNSIHITNLSLRITYAIIPFKFIIGNRDAKQSRAYAKGLG